MPMVVLFVACCLSCIPSGIRGKKTFAYNKKSLTKQCSVKDESFYYPRCHLEFTDTKICALSRILTYPRQLTYATRCRILCEFS